MDDGTYRLDTFDVECDTFGRAILDNKIDVFHQNSGKTGSYRVPNLNSHLKEYIKTFLGAETGEKFKLDDLINAVTDEVDWMISITSLIDINVDILDPDYPGFRIVGQRMWTETK